MNKIERMSKVWKTARRKEASLEKELLGSFGRGNKGYLTTFANYDRLLDAASDEWSAAKRSCVLLERMCDSGDVDQRRAALIMKQLATELGEASYALGQALALKARK